MSSFLEESIDRLKKHLTPEQQQDATITRVLDESLAMQEEVRQLLHGEALSKKEQLQILRQRKLRDIRAFLDDLRILDPHFDSKAKRTMAITDRKKEAQSNGDLLHQLYENDPAFKAIFLSYEPLAHGVRNGDFTVFLTDEERALHAKKSRHEEGETD